MCEGLDFANVVAARRPRPDVPVGRCEYYSGVVRGKVVCLYTMKNAQGYRETR